MSYVFIVNKTKGTNLGNADVANSFFSRFKGLMMVKKLEMGLILKLPSDRSRRASGIHMFFMRIPLDVVFADSDKKVVDTVTLDPWTTYTPVAPARYVIELEIGKIAESNTEIGDELDFTCESA
ncbi:hypothetical protein BK008_04705 [Methanobacterium sp. MZ-A1]|jgi:hypothetical protein|uniref:DUF192 domain-containing protein n=1 Tax=Methanobacterium subterraneum TaxID=59277 RepID=A0A2H4VB84_9EURY|nr:MULTISPECIES: DUF192 domain-containing protein [Methanobacterium]AUB55341.1 hypothetical protein BK007_04475 [Methanobacterium subterraneum]AUB57682.1 hypothetical protein BK008_04705 [Methanobacterium sp. MZ-A1]MBW4256248.1 DUF192 domain-containing protein [Methanobacterium sp. YSL]PKL74095.1 MAG: hypothetical protein CVV29_00125 [Methanobacteriales archaeon HGW-Methanobacteriales-2]